METTVGKLIELLSQYDKNATITNESNEKFIHIVNQKDGSVILSTKKPIAYCNRTGGYVYPTTVDGYFGYCPELDEDVYKFETNPLTKKYIVTDIIWDTDDDEFGQVVGIDLPTTLDVDVPIHEDDVDEYFRFNYQSNGILPQRI